MEHFFIDIDKEVLRAQKAMQTGTPTLTQGVYFKASPKEWARFKRYCSKRHIPAGVMIRAVIGAMCASSNR